MANTIEYAQLFQKELDKQVIQSAASGWMEENAGQVIYNGGREIKIPKMSMQGLGDYSREDGYVDGAVTYSYETHTMSQDRGRRFRVDAMDVNEGNFVPAAATVASEFQRTKVIPEIDAYRFSKLAGAAGITSEYDPAASSVLTELLKSITAVQDVAGDTLGGLVIIMPWTVSALLDSSKEFEKHIDVGGFSQGGVNTQVKLFNGIPILRVPSARMMSDYTFEKNGDGGFKASGSAVQINWIVCPRKAPIAVSKTDNLKIIEPSVNQFADAWDIDYRKYHDIFVPDNKKAVIAVSKATS